MATHIGKIQHITNATFNLGPEGRTMLPSNIPIPKGFIGRDAEIASLLEAKRSGKTSFVLHGLGGIGKTDLALAFIKEIAGDFDAHIKINMLGLAKNPLSAKDARLQVVRAFGAELSTNPDDLEIDGIFLSLVSQNKTLLFLDNAKDRSQVEGLNSANALVIATSRTTFNFTGGFSKEVEKMSPEDARALLCSIVPADRLDGQADALAFLAGYLPMALLPLASLLAEDPTMEARDLVEKYRKQRLELADPNRENLSIEASFDLSYELLTEEMQGRWRKLSVFPSDFDLAAMETVWEIPDGKATRSDLVTRHLLEFNPITKRSHLHDLARDYAQKKLKKDEVEFTRSYGRHCGYYATIISTLEKVTLENILKFDIERRNFETGFFWLLDRIDKSSNACKLCTFYVGYATDILFMRLPLNELTIWQKAGYESYATLGNDKGRAYCLNNLGRISRLSQMPGEAIAFYNEAINIAEGIGEHTFVSLWLGNLANVHLDLHQFEEARIQLARAYKIAVDTNDVAAKARTLASLGDVNFYAEKYPESIEHYENALQMNVMAAERKGLTLCHLAIACIYLDEVDRANDLAREGLQIIDEIGSGLAQTVRKNLGIAKSLFDERHLTL